jgi:hypothetical protein
MHGVDRNEVLSPDWEPLQRLRADHPLHPAVDEVAAGSFRRRSPPEIVGSGYVVKSLEAALWAFHSAENFREAVLKAVNLGDDADTTGAVCGQLAGAYWGVAGIPPEWLAGWPDATSSKRAVGGATGLLSLLAISDKMKAETEMVRNGFAWRYVRYDKAGEFTDAEREAREKRRGLRADPNPVPPWEYWREHRGVPRARP